MIHSAYELKLISEAKYKDLLAKKELKAKEKDRREASPNGLTPSPNNSLPQNSSLSTLTSPLTGSFTNRVLFPASGGAPPSETPPAGQTQKKPKKKPPNLFASIPQQTTTDPTNANQQYKKSVQG